MAISWFYIIGWIASTVAIIGNGLVMFVIISRTRLHILPNWFVLSLALADFVVGLVVVPTDFICKNNVLSSMCTTIAYTIAVLAIYSSVANLCAMTVDRYIAIIKPLRYVTWMTSRRAAFLVALAWIIPIALDLIPALCTVLGKCDMKDKCLIFSKMILLEIIPCLCLLIATIQIIITAKRQWWQNARLHAQLRFNQVSHRQGPRYLSTARVIIIVLVVYLACYCVELYSVIRFLFNSTRPTQEVVNVIVLLAVVNSSVNPIAYALFKRDIRRELITLCRPCASRPARYDVGTAV